ncbi:helix-turn-helix transcriptional regulator [Luteolibacter sp. AS25]|uniref:helix-turn-helix transcriptional regulator n=1 Tax=Luteolibacter sp. AS25 TaxID=3135776 RepID=UPI00398B6A62
MPASHLPHKIIQKDGQLLYTRPSGEMVPMSKLALICRFRIDKICEATDVSPRHLRRMFDQTLGISPKQWLKLERMVIARNILKGDGSIKDIGEYLGFMSQKDFYREFRDFYKIGPSSYRDQQAERVMTQLGWSN